MAQNRTLTLRTAQYKYIEPSNGAAKINTVNIETGYNAKPQLFDIQKDRGETKNLFTALPEVGKSMQTMMQNCANLLPAATRVFGTTS